MAETQGGANVGVPLAIVLAGGLVSVGIFFGLQGLPGAQANNALGSNVTAVPTQAIGDVTDTTPQFADISMDDDPVLGNADAPVTVIEFSDYECPYCKQSFQSMIPSLKSEYIDTGKVKFVFRDFPLYFHDPAATTEAIAANCARAQGDDATYFAYHDLIFNTTAGNGAGLTDAKLTELATGLGLDGSKFGTCLTNKEFADEVEKDMTDGTAAGVNGTPSYFIGKSDPSGTINGEIVIGAVPFASLKATIEKYL